MNTTNNLEIAENEMVKECPKCVYEYDGEITEYCTCPNFKTVEQIKAEAYKEFAENAVIRLAENYRSDYARWIDYTIDNLLREMVGDIK